MNPLHQYQLSPEFDAIKDKDETILWTAKPLFVPYFLAYFKNVLFIIAVNVLMLYVVRNIENGKEGALKIIWFVFLYAMLQSVYLIIKYILTYHKTIYAYSNKRIFIRKGIFSPSFKIINYDKILDMEISVNLVEKYYQTGTIKFFTGEVSNSDNSKEKVYEKWEAITNPYEIFKHVKGKTGEL